MRKFYFFFFLIVTIQANAQTWQEVVELLPSTSYQNDSFGNSVDIDDNLAVISAPNHDLDVNGLNPVNEAGAVYVFEKDSNGDWVQIQKLVAANRTSFERFGITLAVSGDYILIGTDRNDTDTMGNNPLLLAGAVYVFERNTSGIFEEVQKLVASDREIGALFGRTLDIENNTIVIGAFGEDKDASGNNPLISPGATYIFERGTDGVWVETQKLVALMRSDQDAFGSAIAIDGNTIAIGAYDDDDDAQEQNPITDAGSAYIFTKQGNGLWTETAKVSASDRAAEDEFGDGNIDIDGDYLVVGSKFQDQNVDGTDTRENAGAAYVFERDMSGNWVEIQKLVASNRDADDWYGESVGISGDYIIIGSKREDNDSSNEDFDSGAVYIYKKDTNLWNEEQIIRDSNPVGRPLFGNSLKVQGDNLIIGSPSKTISSISSAGSSHIFELDDNLGVIDQTTFNIAVYPNPTKDILHLEVNQPQDFGVTITNALGQIIQDKSFLATTRVTLKIEGDSGLYFLNFTTKNGTSKVFKVMKQ